MTHATEDHQAGRGVRMPKVQFDWRITPGNILSFVTSLIAIGTVVVGLATYGAGMRHDLDGARSDLAAVRLRLDKLEELTERRAQAYSEASSRNGEILARLDTQMSGVIEWLRELRTYQNDANRPAMSPPGP